MNALCSPANNSPIINHYFQTPRVNRSTDKGDGQVQNGRKGKLTNVNYINIYKVYYSCLVRKMIL